MSVQLFRPRLVCRTDTLSRADWLEVRRKGIGGSDAAAVLGLSRYASRNDLWMDKTGRKGERPAGEAAAWGTALESTVAGLYAQTTGRVIHRAPYLLAHPNYPWMQANLDYLERVDGVVGILEIKTALSEKAPEVWQDGQVPINYYWQVMHYMAVTGYPFADIAALITGPKLIKVRVPRDEEAIKRLIDAEADFWTQVELDQPPEEMTLEDKLVVTRVKATPDKTVELTGDGLAALAAYQQARQVAEVAKREMEEAQARLQSELQDAVIGNVEGHPVIRWKEQTTNRLDQAALKALYPVIYEKCLKESISRPFVVEKAK